MYLFLYHEKGGGNQKQIFNALTPPIYISNVQLFRYFNPYTLFCGPCLPATKYCIIS